jgi:hypothetical protein
MRLSLVGVSELPEREIAGRSYLIGGYGLDWIDSRGREEGFWRVCNILTCMLFVPHDSPRRGVWLVSACCCSSSSSLARALAW